MTREIQKACRHYFMNNDYKLFNVFMYGWECDFFSMTSSGYAVEVEIKVSRSDFFADFKKKDKHKLFRHRNKEAVCIAHGWGGFNNVKIPGEQGYHRAEFSNIQFNNPLLLLPNRFYYACPEGLIFADEVPNYAGLLYYRGNFLHEVKKAPLLHREKVDKTKTLLSKYYNKFYENIKKIHLLNYELLPHLDEEGERILQQFISKFHFED